MLTVQLPSLLLSCHECLYLSHPARASTPFPDAEEILRLHCDGLLRMLTMRLAVLLLVPFR
jgi:hypothetical protein